jgi:hypothetical protein
VKQDPLALAVFGAALALLAGLLVYVFFFKAPEQASAAPTAILEEARARAVAMAERLGVPVQGRAVPTPVPLAPQRREAPPPGRVSAQPAPAAPVPPAGAVPGYPIYEPRPGVTWIYRVSVEPPAWQDAALTYRVLTERGATVVDTDFTHARGSMKFRLGTFQAGHPSHANTKFPGFFMYPSYFGKDLRVGQALAWEWPWQLQGGGVKAGRVKRFEGSVVAPEQYQGPVFPMASMLRIEGTLSYLDEGRVQAVARERLWYAGKAMQLVRIEREGRTPDEGATRIVAELVEMRL